jgi:hypothetical protein
MKNNSIEILTLNAEKNEIKDIEKFANKFVELKKISECNINFDSNLLETIPGF